MSSVQMESETVYCTSCGTEMLSSSYFCPECEALQDITDLRWQERLKIWGIGFKPGEGHKLRNIIVFGLYLNFVGLMLLVYANFLKGLGRNPNKRKYHLLVIAILVIPIALRAVQVLIFQIII